MKSLALFAAAGILSAAGVTAHGYVDKVTIGSTVYTGYQPYQDPYTSPAPQRIIRKVPGNGPVTELNLIDVQCNGYSAGGVVGSAPAATFATVAAGSTVKLTWTTWPDSHMGPLITYMAKVPSGQSVTSWNPGSSAVWFKVHEAGYVNGKWAAIKLISDGNVYSFTIPATLAPGQYIIRHEIIALHGAGTYPGAQVYPSCIQVQVTGSGTKTPTSGLVSFPGAYSASTPGIVFDVYGSSDPTKYKIPGPAVWSG